MVKILQLRGRSKWLKGENSWTLGGWTLRVMKCVPYGRARKNEGKNWKFKLVAIAPGWWQRPANPVYCNEHSSENTISTTISAGELGCFVFHFLNVWVFWLRICSSHHMCAVPTEVRRKGWISLNWNCNHKGAGNSMHLQQQGLLMAGSFLQAMLWFLS